MPTLPPAPATIQQALPLANQLAYGFGKHTDINYWSRYETDPEYFWKRLLGWQANSDGQHPEDVAKYGLYAKPPSEWNFPEPVPVDNDEEETNVEELKTLDTLFNELGSKLDEIKEINQKNLEELQGIRSDLSKLGEKLEGALGSGGLNSILDIFRERREAKSDKSSNKKI